MKFILLILSSYILFALLCCKVHKHSEKHTTPTVREYETSRKDKRANQTAETAQAQQTQSDDVRSKSFNSLRKLRGKYPYEVHLFDNTALIYRLKNLLHERYTFLRSTMAVESPIEVYNDVFIASGCQAHNCGNTNYIIVIDFKKNVVYAGIREEKIVTTYSEDGSSNEELIRWANRRL